MDRYPLQVRAQSDATPGRWLWLVKWLLLIPHYLVLAVLWVAFAALTLVAYVAVLFTGRYPHAIHTFNTGVLRWSWRVGYYGYEALGTDRYPPFTLAEVPDYPAGLHVDYPPQHRRWLPLVAWLLVFPHLLILAALAGTTWQVYQQGNATVSAPAGLIPVVVLIVAVALLFTGRYPRGLYDLLIGVARWSLRVIAYISLLTPKYPPFRLDQGGREPDGEPSGPDRITAPASTAPPAAVTAAPVAAAPPTDGAAVAGRVIALVAGVLFLLVSVPTGLGGAGVLVLNAARDAGGYVSSSTIEVTTATAAVTAEGIELQAGEEWTRDLGGFGDVRVTASSPDGTPLFLGIAAEADVDRWLGGTAHDELTNPYAENQVEYQRAPGVARGVGPPAEQTFWLATAGGTGTAVLTWTATTGRFAVVLANADGSLGVTAAVRVATGVPNLAPLGITLVSFGAVLLLGGFVLIYVGAVGIGRRHIPPPAGQPTPIGPPRPEPTAPRAPVGSAPGSR